MTRSEYHEKIENKLLDAMNEIDESVRLMNLMYHENHKEASKALEAKAVLKKLLNTKFDRFAPKKKV